MIILVKKGSDIITVQINIQVLACKRPGYAPDLVFKIIVVVKNNSN